MYYLYVGLAVDTGYNTPKRGGSWIAWTRAWPGGSSAPTSPCAWVLGGPEGTRTSVGELRELPGPLTLFTRSVSCTVFMGGKGAFLTEKGCHFK